MSLCGTVLHYSVLCVCLRVYARVLVCVGWTVLSKKQPIFSNSGANVLVSAQQLTTVTRKPVFWPGIHVDRGAPLISSLLLVTPGTPHSCWSRQALSTVSYYLECTNRINLPS